MGHTIAYQLSLHSNAAREKLILEVAAQPPVTTLGIAEQAGRLLATPLRSVPHFHNSAATPPLIVIIDALDECEDVASGAGETLLDILIPAICHLPGHAKLFISSRNEGDLTHMFADLFARHNVDCAPLLLHEVDGSVVRGDIERYLARALLEVRKRRPFVPETWPTTEEVQSLAQLSDNMFLFAATVVRFIDDKRHYPVERLQQVLTSVGQMVPAHDNSPYSSLDQLYLDILKRATDAEDVEASINTRIRLLLAAVLLVNDDLTLRDLALLVGVDLYVAGTILQNLSAVLTYPDPCDPDTAVVRVFHPSFADFLIDERRCKDLRFQVLELEHEGQLALHCARLMTDQV